MPFTTDQIFPSGGMDKDKDLSLVSKEDYIDALNVQHMTDGGQTSYSIQNSKGNKLRFVIPPTAVQNKQYQILMQVSSGTLARQITIYDTNGGVVCVVGWSDNATTIATTYSNFTTALAAAMPGGQTYTVSASGNYAIFTLTTITGFEYSIQDTQGINPTPIVILQEAWDKSLIGNANIIGSRDILGQLCIYSTPQTNAPTTFTGIISATSSSSGLIEVALTSAISPTLVTGQSVSISGTATTADGIWIITVVDSTHFKLQNSSYSSAASGGNVTINVSGIGEVGVAIYDPNKGVTTYTTLLKSKELNFNTQNQIDAYGETNNFQTSNYWTDDYNPPRVFYYLNGPFVANGGITAINPSGQYQYGNIATETKLVFSNSGAIFNFTGQSVSGGAIQSGNWRYAIQFLTATFGESNWSDLSNPVNVYLANQQSSANLIGGDLAGTITGKVNNFQITNIPTGVYAYVQLAAIHYVGSAIVGAVVNQFAITGSTMQISHTGNEANTTDLDLATLEQLNFDIETAKNIDAIDNRLILSNLTTSQIVDFSSFALSLTHFIGINNVPWIGDPTVGCQYGEYQNPVTVYNNMGYMINDTYRIGVKFRLKATGNTTQVFFVDDIRVDSNTSNITTPNRRVSTAITGNLTSSDSTIVYVPYIQINNLNMNYLINGVPIGNLISEIHFEVVERVPEVLATGIIVATITGKSNTYVPTAKEIGYDGASQGSGYGEYPCCIGFGGSGPQNLYVAAAMNFTNLQYVVKFYSPDIFYGQNSVSWQTGDVMYNYGSPTTDSNAYYAAVGKVASPQHYASDYLGWTGYLGYAGVTTVQVNTLLAVSVIPDNYIGSIQVNNGTGGSVGYVGYISDYQYGIQLPQRGGPIITSSSIFQGNGASSDIGFYYAQYFRAKSPSTYAISQAAVHSKYGDPALSKYMPTGSIFILANNSTSISIAISNVTSDPAMTTGPGTLIVITTATPHGIPFGQPVTISGVTGTTNANGTYYAQVLSPTTFLLGYGYPSGSAPYFNANYISGGTISWIPQTQSVFGGDVFTQKTYIKNRGTDDANAEGAACGFSFYSQNVVNSQMGVKNNNNIAWSFPATVPTGSYNEFQQWLLVDPSLDRPIAPYDTGYDIINNISNDSAFDPELPQQPNLPTEIRWSDLKPQNSVIDNYRSFLPLNFFDLPMTFGPILWSGSFNGELFTIQPRQVQRQYFNTRGTLTTAGQTSETVILGSGTVMSQPGQMVTVIGTYNKWSVIKGKSDQGNDTLYWINTELKKVMRMGFDGTIKVSDIHGMQSFFANNLKWVAGIDTPAAGQGICGTWDDRYSCVIWTVRGKKQGFPVYNAGKSYGLNDVVQYTPSSFSTFEQTGEFYVSAITSNSGNEPDTNPSDWVLIPHVYPTDFVIVNGVTYNAKDYYNEYTIEFNEQKNKFTSFYTFKPAIYLKWTDTFLTPSPVNTTVNNTGAVYQHRLGQYCTWYSNLIAITSVSNATPMVVTTTTNHGFTTGDIVNILQVTGNTDSNGEWTIIVLSATTFSLTGSYTSGSAGSGGYVADQNVSNDAQNGYISLLYNQNINSNKMYLAMWVSALLSPSRIDFYTQNFQSYLLNSDFTKNQEFWMAPIKNDILTSSDGNTNSQDTSKIFGRYLISKVSFASGVFQRLTDIVLKFFTSQPRADK